ncbi:hypothetical protein C8R46DRAFT_1358762 [Mycena filopes]|nr:hypothetical protein C8R46DRAFT_1358762 [Mycena filopes]
MTTLLELPTEILAHILEEPSIPFDTLYHLSLLSRRLHFVALSVYLSRQGLNSTTKLLYISMTSRGRDTLAVLEMALFIPEVQSFIFILPHPSCVSILPLLRQLERIQTYISRLHRVNSVVLQLDQPASICLSVGDERALRAWCLGLGSLLNCIVERQCTSLTVKYGAQLTRAYERRRPPRPHRNPFRRLLAVLRRDSTTHTVSDADMGAAGMAAPPESNHLRTLWIHSEILLVPPALDWTLALLRKSRITSLTLGSSVAAPLTWRAVLPLIASATEYLTSLVILDAHLIPADDMLDFVAHLPALVDLTISSLTYGGRLGPAASLVRLPNLTTLRAPPNFVLHFLRNPPLLPRLRSVAIQWPTVCEPGAVAALGTLLADVVPVLSTRTISPTISLTCGTPPVMASGHHQLLPYYSGRGFPEFFELVSALNIVTFPNVEHLGAWVALFRRAHRVDITLAGAGVLTLVRSIRPTPFLSEVTVNGRVYPLVNDGEE